MGVFGNILVVAALELAALHAPAVAAPRGPNILIVSEDADTDTVPRGEYLVRAVAHCGECHTPRTMTMATDNSRFLGGNPKGPEDQAMPNITPDPDTGIGKWTVEEIADYLGTGNKPDGDVAGGLMGEAIDGTLAGYKDLTKADRVAIAQYLKTIPPVRNKVVITK